MMMMMMMMKTMMMTKMMTMTMMMMITTSQWSWRQSGKKQLYLVCSNDWVSKCRQRKCRHKKKYFRTTQDLCRCTRTLLEQPFRWRPSEGCRESCPWPPCKADLWPHGTQTETRTWASLGESTTAVGLKHKKIIIIIKINK
jgi:hypothetical protein